MQKASLPAAVRPGIFYRVLERKLRPKRLWPEKALAEKSLAPELRDDWRHDTASIVKTNAYD
jgi:hypothetical protein